MLRSLGLSLILLLACSTPGLVSAQATSIHPYTIERISGDIEVGDFVVGPGRAELTVRPGETIKTEITVTNRISAERTFRLQLEDIAGTTDGSDALVVLEGERGPHSLRDYVTLPHEEITLQLGERARIPIVVSVPPDAQPGGYYGSVLVSTVRAARDDAPALPQNPIIARVGSHIFLTVSGTAEYNGRAAQLQTLPSAAWYRSGPITFGLTFENSGAVHLNPSGAVSITNLLGQEVGYLEIEPWFVLPQSVRTREFTWTREFLLGRYQATAVVNRSYDDIEDTVTVSFWVVPYPVLLALLAGLFVLALMLLARRRRAVSVSSV